MKAVAFVFAFLALIEPALIARGADPYPIKRMIIVVDPASQVNVPSLQSYRQGYVHYECLGFRNTNAKPIAKVVFAFVYYDAKQEYVGQDVMERTGTFVTGTGEDMPVVYRGQDFSRYRNCMSYNFPKQGIAFTVLNVRRVEYADGTSWSLAEATSPPTPTP